MSLIPAPKIFGGTHYMGVPYALPLSIVFFIFFLIGTFIHTSLLVAVLTWLFILSPIWAPLVLLGMFWTHWVIYIRAAWNLQQTPVLLEIKIPRQILKTPRAMELVFVGLNIGPGETTFISRWWDGKVRPTWSFELVSIEGKIHFYVWVWQKHQEFVESQFYAQYPDIEIQEVEDYTAGVYSKPDENFIWGMEFALAKADAYPIKTYIDYEMDQDAKKAEQIVDPLSNVFEKLSSLGPGEQLWMQIIVRQNKGAPIRSSIWGKTKTWQEEAQAEIDRIYDASRPESRDPVTAEIVEGYPQLKPGELNTIKALERSTEKGGFDTGIRAVYITRPDSFKGNKIPTDIVNIFTPFASGSLNKLTPGGMDWHVSLDYPWQDFMKIREKGFSRNVIDAYKRRAMFYEPYKAPRFVLTTEELATIYHFPSEETKAPGIERIPSVKGDAPVNLPV